MTVSKAIEAWVQGYGMELSAITAYSFCPWKMPAREVKNYADSAYEITEYYRLSVGCPAQQETELETDEEWMENFAYWVDDCPFNENLPLLDKERRCLSVELMSMPYLGKTQELNTNLYQVILKVTYERKGR